MRRSKVRRRVVPVLYGTLRWQASPALHACMTDLYIRLLPTIICLMLVELVAACTAVPG